MVAVCMACERQECMAQLCACAGGLPLDVLDAALASAFATCRQNISALESTSRSAEKVWRPSFRSRSKDMWSAGASKRCGARHMPNRGCYWKCAR